MAKKLLTVLGNVVHCLQRERGCSTLYLASRSTLFSGRLDKARLQTNRGLEDLASRLQALGPTGPDPGHRSPVTTLGETRSHLATFRRAVSDLSLSPSECLSTCSHTMIAPFIRLMTGIARSGAVPVSSVDAYENLLLWKDTVGLERALGGRGLATNALANEEFLERIFFLLTEQESHERAFLSCAPDALRERLSLALKTDSGKTLEQIHRRLKREPGRAWDPGLEPEIWFDLLTEKVDALHSCETLISEALPHTGEPSTSPDPGHTWPVTCQRSEEAVIRALPLFAALSGAELAGLLRHGAVRRLPKGRLLFLEGEQPHHLYIVLSGWLKVFKATPDGEEAVLQMLGEGCALMESSVYLDRPLSASVQVAQDATLLSLPAPVLREQIRSSNSLALGVLTSMASNSQKMIRQIESSRLQSVDDRLGNFLLGLLNDQGRVSRSIRLPYDKSLVASGLNMKRETLSRALGRLKAKGWRVESNTVVIPTLSALCGHCDPALSAECPSRDTCENSGGASRETAKPA
ncbi:nitrate- and nitrite sensing domain-containing protein [Phaeovibrio sulfidiphilus]|uniref:nitrate- and nitrite sensing domain-containing protein n=1 Tax=Phaeovibrio sulfidiphilus TaxID=1220600 RepID=UPI003B837DB0